MNKTATFEELKQEISDALKLRSDYLEIKESVTLVDGFVHHPLSNDMSDSLLKVSISIPMIMLLGDKSGRIYFFALKAILTEDRLLHYGI